jgi:hypothetical protein
MRRKLIPLYGFVILFAFLIGLSVQNLLRASTPGLLDWICLLFSIAATLNALATLCLIDENPQEEVI